MKLQKELIGSHPDNSNLFGIWLDCEDLERTSSKCHRSLTVTTTLSENDIINWLAERLIHHHYSAFRLKRLKKKYKELGFSKYAEQHRKLPIADKVKKGNATEVILTEYIESCLGKELIKVFKLKYNPNVDQAIKGDDTLMVDIEEHESKNRIKVFLGEAKFRTTPSKQVITDIVSSLSEDKNPLSYSFLVEELAKDPTKEYLAEILDDYIIEDIKGKGDLIYTGFLLSNTETSVTVDKHLNTTNPNMILISIGIENPTGLINNAFLKAEELISTLASE